MLRNEQDPSWFSPDGLTGVVLDELIESAYAAVADAPPATSALVDGSARERRARREAQRALGGTVRVLRVFGPVSGVVGREAA